MEQLLEQMLQQKYGKTLKEASKEEVYVALLCITKEKMKGLKQN